MRTGSIQAVALGFVIALTLGNPRPTLAGGETLMHGVQSLLASPLEFAVSPYVAADTLNQNMKVQEYSPQAKALATIPGFSWLWLGQLGIASARMVSGMLEVPIGLAVIPFEWQPKPLLDVATEPALATSRTDPTFKFGIYYAKRE